MSNVSTLEKRYAKMYLLLLLLYNLAKKLEIFRIRLVMCNSTQKIKDIHIRKLAKKIFIELASSL